MQKQKLKLDQDDLKELLRIMRIYIEETDNSEDNYQIVVRSVLQSLLIKLLTKMLDPKKKYSISLKEYEAYSVRQMIYSTFWADPFTISLTERILAVPIQ